MDKDYDEIILYFRDGGQTVIFVLKDDDIPQAIVDECHEHTWDSNDVIGFRIRPENPYP